jgi:hypothetical protein
VPDQAFTGDLVVLRRMARVRNGTSVAMFTEGEPPMLRQPGELLLPDRNPLKHRISVMPITTEPVRLRVRVVDLLTLDGQHLEAVEMAVTVQLNATDPGRLLELAAKRGPGMGAFLNEQVREGIENTARAGVKMSTRAELHHQGLAATLRERWLPRSFVGLLFVTGFEVVAEEWATPTVVHRPHVSPPEAGAPRSSPVSSAASHAAAPPVADPPDLPGSAAVADASLSTDVRLLTIWRRRLPEVPRGIASAKVGDDACVVAVVDSDPPAFESRQLWEDLAGLLDDRHLRLLLCRGRTYEDIVRSWFSQLGLPARLDDQLGVEVSRGRVDVRLPAELADDLGPRWTGLDGPPVAALRRLLASDKIVLGYEERD